MHSLFKSIKKISNKYKCLLLIFIFLLLFYLLTPITSAFDENELYFINIGIPLIRAIFRAQKNNQPLAKAITQAIFGGYIMQQGFKLAPQLENSSFWRAWQAKLMVNFGASMAESAGDEFAFKMDVGPVWLIVKDGDAKFTPALNAIIAPIQHFANGADLDIKKSLKFGTLAFNKGRRFDGSISKTGALAYSNANSFITNKRGNHAGHEMVHTFQYRREALLSPGISDIFPELKDKFSDKIYDDSHWFLSWRTQCFIAKQRNKNTNFDIPMEKEAYYLEHKYFK